MNRQQKLDVRNNAEMILSMVESLRLVVADTHIHGKTLDDIETCASYIVDVMRDELRAIAARKIIRALGPKV